MFAKKTVFILGAGASEEVGLPLGSALATLISQKMNVEFDSFGSLTKGDVELGRSILNGEDGPTFLRAAHRLRDGLPVSKSIDEFLDFHRTDKSMVRLGKAAIIRTILEQESHSKLSFHRDDSLNFHAVSQTWFTKLMHMLGHGDPAKVFENVAFVNFNYDRCLEHFLFHGIRARYALEARSAREILATAKIFHPYGIVAPLPELANDGTGFGNKMNLDWKSMSDRIRTYTEELEVTAQLQATRDEIASAHTLVFLGFAFHKQNLDLLAQPGSLRKKRVFASAYGISNSDLHVVRSRLYPLFEAKFQSVMSDGERIKLHNNLKCSGLMDEYMLTLPV